MLNTNIRAVLFDLDGTLLDTAPDLAHALNTLRNKHGQANLPLAKIRTEASNGAKGLLKLGFGIAENDLTFTSLRDEFLSLYENNIALHTQLFEGMESVLSHLDEQVIPWGIVTNKPAYLTHALLAKTHLENRTMCIVSGDTVSERKPSPLPMYHACHLLSITPDACVYIGDAERDVQAGKRAGMKTLIAHYGYLGTDEDVTSWNADAIITHPSDIITWLTAQSNKGKVVKI